MNDNRSREGSETRSEEAIPLIYPGSSKKDSAKKRKRPRERPEDAEFQSPSSGRMTKPTVANQPKRVAKTNGQRKTKKMYEDNPASSQQQTGSEYIPSQRDPSPTRSPTLPAAPFPPFFMEAVPPEIRLGGGEFPVPIRESGSPPARPQPLQSPPSRPSLVQPSPAQHPGRHPPTEAQANTPVKDDYEPEERDIPDTPMSEDRSGDNASKRPNPLTFDFVPATGLGDGISRLTKSFSNASTFFNFVENAKELGNKELASSWGRLILSIDSEAGKVEVPMEWDLKQRSVS